MTLLVSPEISIGEFLKILNNVHVRTESTIEEYEVNGVGRTNRYKLDIFWAKSAFGARLRSRHSDNQLINEWGGFLAELTAFLEERQRNREQALVTFAQRPYLLGGFVAHETARDALNTFAFQEGDHYFPASSGLELGGKVVLQKENLR